MVLGKTEAHSISLSQRGSRLAFYGNRKYVCKSRISTEKRSMSRVEKEFLQITEKKIGNSGGKSRQRCG